MKSHSHSVWTILALFWVWVALVPGPSICSGSTAASGVIEPGQLASKAIGVLRDNCLSCHGDGKIKGGLTFMTREAILKGGDEGPAVTPGKPDSSRLLNLLQPGADPHMPPKKQLTPDQIDILSQWIQAELPWDAKALSAESVPIAAVEIGPWHPSFLPAYATALSPDAQTIAFGRGDRLFLHGLSTTNQPRLNQSQTTNDPVFSLAWSPDGKVLVSGGFRHIRFWSVPELALSQVVTNSLMDRITALEFSPDGKYLAAGDGVNGRNGFVRLFRADNRSLHASWHAHADVIFDLEFSRDSKRLVTASGDKLIKVWESATHQLIATLEGHTAQVLGAAFNTNATQVVSGGADRQLKVWDIATKERVITLGNHLASITRVAWPGNGEAVVAVTDSGGVFRYTNLKPHTGEQSSATGDETRIGEFTDAVLSLSIAEDGKTIAAGAHDGSIRIWSASSKLLGTFLPDPPPVSATSLTRASVPSDGLLAQTAKAITKRSISAKRQSKPLLKPSQVLRLSAEPVSLILTPDSPQHRVIITAHTVDGFEVDVTELAQYSVSRRSPFQVDSKGVVTANSQGRGTLTVEFLRKTSEMDIQVRAARSAVTPANSLKAPLPDFPLSFVRDVLPAMNRAGCSAGSCHAKADGQNGFKLSVFSYDPRADYAEVVKDAHGRRVFPSAPDESLLLKKPLGTTPHEGGQRLNPGSPTHRLIARWMREGLPYAFTNEPALQHITVFPKERRYRKNVHQQLLVQAHYADGSSRDVTGLAAFESNDKELAKVDDDGRVTVAALTGQGVIVTRYMGFVAPSLILVPSDRVLPESQYSALPRNNFIDEHAYAQFQRLGLFPSNLAADHELVRRISLDTIGVLPTPQEARLWADSLAKAGGTDRQRTVLAYINELLERPEFGDYWANRWADLLRPNPDRVGVKSILVLDQWLRESFRENIPYDRFVRQILTAEGSNHRYGPAVIYRDRREPPELTTMFSQLFLGTRLECAKCHHHPNEKWGQEDFYQLAAYFGPVKQKGAGLSPPISAGTETFYFAAGGSVKHPVSGDVMTPRPPDGPALSSEAKGDPRAALADWLTQPSNPFFARAAVNRVWANYFGRGLVDPVDDFRISNPCVNPALLDALAEDFAKHQYDWKHLIRTIVSSHLYQLSSTPNESNLADTKNFSRSYRRRLPAEVLLDAVSDATGVPESFAAMPAGFRAMQTWSYKIESHFLDAFGRPNASSDCPCERDRQMSVVQSLHLMNSKNLQSKLSHADGRARKFATSSKPEEEIVSELYYITLGRAPDAEELRLGTALFKAPNSTRQIATEDVLWALLNSAEFVLNH